jgi:transposase-like protein
MASYSKELKGKMITRMLPPNNEPVSKISKETKISIATLHKWKKSLSASDQQTVGRKKPSDYWSSQDKFLIVMETASMNEIELSNYCRSKGLYVEQIKEWKNVCIQANGGIAQEASRLNKEMKVKDKEIKSLEKELQRKEKALAETAAILVLRKKLNTLLGTDDEEE